MTPEYLPEQSLCPACDLPTPGSLAAEPFIQYCVWHQPAIFGAEDWKAGVRTLGHGAGEADGADCRAFAEALRPK